MDDRRVTKEAASAGRECTRMTAELSGKNGAEEKISSVDEEVSRSEESKETEC